jgi:hypothetical protein
MQHSSRKLLAPRRFLCVCVMPLCLPLYRTHLPAFNRCRCGDMRVHTCPSLACDHVRGACSVAWRRRTCSSDSADREVRAHTSYFSLHSSTTQLFISAHMLLCMLWHTALRYYNSMIGHVHLSNARTRGTTRSTTFTSARHAPGTFLQQSKTHEKRNCICLAYQYTSPVATATQKRRVLPLVTATHHHQPLNVTACCMRLLCWFCCSCGCCDYERADHVPCV